MPPAGAEPRDGRSRPASREGARPSTEGGRLPADEATGVIRPVAERRRRRRCRPGDGWVRPGGQHRRRREPGRSGAGGVHQQRSARLLTVAGRGLEGFHHHSCGSRVACMSTSGPRRGTQTPRPAAGRSPWSGRRTAPSASGRGQHQRGGSDVLQCGVDGVEHRPRATPACRATIRCSAMSEAWLSSGISGVSGALPASRS